MQLPPPPVEPTAFPRLRENLQLKRELASLYEETISRIPCFTHSMKMDLLEYTLEGLIQVSAGTDYTVHTLQFIQVLLEDAFKVQPLEVRKQDIFPFCSFTRRKIPRVHLGGKGRACGLAEGAQGQKCTTIRQQAVGMAKRHLCLSRNLRSLSLCMYV